MKKVLFLSVIVLLLSGIPAMAGDDAVLAKIGDKKIMLSDFKRIVGYYDAGRQKAIADNPQNAERMLKMLIEGEVISKIAREKGFDKRPDISEQASLMNKTFIASEYVKKEIIDKLTATEEDMTAYYRTHQDELRTPEMVRARHILVRVNMKKASDEDKKNAREKIEGLLKRIKAGEDMGKLAVEFSDDPASRKKEGDLGFFPKGKMLSEFDNIVFSLKSGELSDVFETSFGYHIVRIEEKKEAFLEPLEKMKDMVREKVLAEFKKVGVEDFLQKSFKDAGVEWYPEALAPKQ